MKRDHLIGAPGVVIAVLLCVLSGCKSPMHASDEEHLRDQMLATHRARISAVARDPAVTLKRTESEVEKSFSPEKRDELDRMAGPSSYKNAKFNLGPDLTGNADIDALAMNLKTVIQQTVKNNLAIQFARLAPAISETQITQAMAVFDAVWYGEFNYNNLDSIRPVSIFGPTFGGEQLTRTTIFQTGIKKNLTSGGQIKSETQFSRESLNPTSFATNPNYSADVLITLTQPLLRNFGAEVNLSEVHLAESGKQQAVADLETELLRQVSDAETAYWALVLVRQQYLIQQRLFDRTVEDRDRLAKRVGVDVTQVRLTEANSFVEIRRAEVIRARNTVRVASDALKRIIQSPEAPLSGETLIVPLETPADLPITFSLLDSVATALRSRPELKKALYQIKDATIRQRVADNQRLPLLNFVGTLRFNGQGLSVGSAYDSVTDGHFVDYLLGIQFESPIGNRAAEALLRQRQLERRAAVINYQNVCESVVQELKDALRNLSTSYQLIGATRGARRAATENLRTIEVQEQTGNVNLNAEFLLDLKLQAQQRLADTEIAEMQSLTDYNTAISNYYRAMGALLERNGIEFKEPAPPSDVEYRPK